MLQGMVENAAESGRVDKGREHEARTTVLFEVHYNEDGEIVKHEIVTLLLANKTGEKTGKTVHTFCLRALNREVRGRRLAQWMYESSYLLPWEVDGGSDVFANLRDYGTREQARSRAEERTGLTPRNRAPGRPLSSLQSR